MSALSVRNLPEKIDKALRREAKRLKKSKSEIVIFALEQLLRVGEPHLRRQRLEDFFGKMTKLFVEALGTEKFHYL